MQERSEVRFKSSKKSSLEGYGTLWKMLSATGIDVQGISKSESNCSECRKCISYCFFPLYLVSSIYVMYILVALGMDSKFFKVFVAYMVTSVMSFYLWIVMYRKKSDIQCLLKELEQCNRRFSPHSFKRSFSINATLAFIWISLLLYSFTSILIPRESGNFNPTWTFGYQVYFNAPGYIAIFACNILYIMQQVNFPCFISYVLSVTYLSCENLLKQYKRKLKHHEDKDLPLSDIISYSDILKVVERLNQVASAPAFLCSAIFFIQVCSLVAYILIYNNDIPNTFVLEFSYVSAMSSFSLIYLPLTASSIPIRMRKIKVLLESRYENALWNPETDKLTLDVLETLKRKQCFEMSGCQTLFYTRSYILSTFGALLTYGLLFTNIGTERENSINKCLNETL